MRKLKLFYLPVLIGLIQFMPALSQSYQETGTSKTGAFQWPEGKKMAISLTFDDARLSQIDTGIPLLNKYGVRATFYVSPDNLTRRTEGWRKAVANGHEIGNHSLRHPCTGNFEWARSKALENYTNKSMKAEIDSANRFIKTIVGVKAVSFAYPCGQTFTGRGKKTKSYVPVIATMFETGRGWLGEGPNDPSFCDFFQLSGMELDGKSPEQIIALVEKAKSKGSWLILAGHEMNVSGNQTSLLETIEALCRYASDPANGIWIDNVHNIAAWVIQQRQLSGGPKSNR